MLLGHPFVSKFTVLVNVRVKYSRSLIEVVDSQYSYTGNLIEVDVSNLNDTLVGDLDDTLGMNGTLGDIIDTDTSTWEDQLINILENEDTTTFEDQLSISQNSTTMDNLHDDRRFKYEIVVKSTNDMQL